MKRVILSSGQPVDVHPVPPFFLTAVQNEYRVDADMAGDSSLAALETRAQAVREAAWLMALPSVIVPAGWKFPFALEYCGIEPREGDVGLWLDYVEYGLLATGDDVRAVQAAMYGAPEVTEDEIRDAEATFPADGGRGDAFAYPVAAE